MHQSVVRKTKRKWCPDFLLLVVISMGSLSSCSTEIDILGDTRSSPVVYCVIDPIDSVYRLYLSKIFFGNESAWNMAQDTSKLFYSDAEVQMEVLSKGMVVWSTTFEPDPTPRDSGAFSSQPGSSYKTNKVLMSYFKYTDIENMALANLDFLRITVKSTKDSVLAFSRIPSLDGKPAFINPVSNFREFHLYDSLPYRVVFPVNLDYYYDLRFNINLREYSGSDYHDTVVNFSIQPR